MPNSEVVEITVPAALDGERLDRVISAIFDCSRAEASALIAASAVTSSGREMKTRSVKVAAGQELSFTSVPTSEKPLPAAEKGIEFEVVYDDEHIAIINKPAGLVVHPAPGHKTGTLVNGLLNLWPEVGEVGEPHRPGIVHRLDRGTSGLMTEAKTQMAYLQLVEMLSTHDVLRSYIALVVGWPEHQRGSIEAPIGRSPRDHQRMTVIHDGKPATTHYSLRDRFDDPFEASTVECELETGRTHQIRVHLRSIGLPILGDAKYGRCLPSVPLDRPFLHSETLGFAHPVTDEDLEFTTELPDDLAKVLARFSIASDREEAPE